MRDSTGSAAAPAARCRNCLRWGSFIFEPPSRVTSLDHLVGAAEQRRRQIEAERLCGLEVNYKLVLGRCLHWQIGWLLTFENTIDVAGRAAVRVDRIRPVRDQAATGDEVAAGVDGGQFVPGYKRDDQVAMNQRQHAPRQDHAAVRGAREGRKSALDLAGIEHVDRAQLNTEGRRHGLERAPLTGPRGYGGIPNDGRPRDARRDLFEQFQPLRADTVFECGKTGDVAARPRQALDEPGAHWIRSLREYDRHGPGRLQQRRYDRASTSQDDVRRERGQFRRVPTNALGIARAPANVDPQVAAVGPA